MLKLFRNTLKEITDFVLPPLCICCDRVLHNDERLICGNCFASIERTGPSPPCERWSEIDISFSLYNFSGAGCIRKLLHALKYEKVRSAGILLGRELGFHISENFEMRFGLAVPVPLHTTKKRERTYNQSDMICYGIKEVLGIKVAENCLKRVRYTESQTALGVHQRMENVRGAFELNKKYCGKIKDMNVILVDDVITTGSTISECARVLKKGGCGKVFACSAAMALPE